MKALPSHLVNLRTITLRHPPAARLRPFKPRRHKDIFTGPEAAAYLGLSGKTALATLAREFGLPQQKPVGKQFLYHREDLDRVAMKMFGKSK